jgi:PAS domain S-box-containing protein
MPSNKKQVPQEKTKKSERKRASKRVDRTAESEHLARKPGKRSLVLRRNSNKKPSTDELIKRFSSFPDVNPMPIVEINATGKVLYMNPAAKKLFPDLSAGGVKHPFLAGLSSAVDELESRKKKWALRQAEVEGTWYGQTIFAVEGVSRIRIYATDITESRRTRQALERSERRFKNIYDESPVGIEVYDWNGQLLQANKSCLEIFGASNVAEVRGFRLFEDPNLSEKAKERLLEGKAVRYEGPFDFEKVKKQKLYKTSKSGLIYLDVVITPLAAVGGKSEGGFLVQVQDITGRKNKEEKLRQLNRVLKALSDSNQAMMHATSESDYLKEVCQFIIKDCGYSMVWIGFAENDENKTVKPAAEAGFEGGYLKTVNITWADTERGRGPTGTAIRTGKPAICRNMLTDPDFKPWRKEALKRGYASSIVLPLNSGDKTFGAINIYSKEPDPFSDEEIDLLTELSSDLAYGIMTFRLRLAHQEAEAALAKSEEKYRFLYEEGQSFNLIIGPDQSVKDVNKAALDILGYKKNNVIGRPALDFVPVEDQERVKGILAETFAGGTTQEYEVPVLAKDGSIHIILFAPGQATLMEGESISGIVVTGIDITHRKQAEEVLREAKDLLEIRVRERTAELEEANQKLKEEIAERVHTEKSLRLEQSRLDALFRLSQISEAPVNEMAEFTLDQGIALTQSEIGFLGFLSEDETIYTLHAVSKDVVKECNVTGNPMQWHVAGAGIWAEAIRQRRTLFVNDYSQPYPAKKGLPPGHPPVNRFMVVPVFEGKRIVAVAGMGNKSTDYDKSDERQIVLLLGGMWSYVQRSLSREALQEAYDKLEERVEQRTAELKASTMALKESQTRLQSVLDNSIDVVYRLNLQTDRYEYFSPSCREVYSFSPEEMIAMSPEESLNHVHPEDYQRVKTELKKSFERESSQIDLRWRTKSGEYRWLSTNLKIIRDAAGRPLYRDGTVRDVTARKQAEEALQDSQRDLERAQAVAHIGSWRLDIKRNELAWSDETYRIFGIPQGQSMTYETFISSVHPKDREFVDNAWKAAMRGEHYDIEHRIIAGKEVKWVREQAELEFDQSGKLVGGFGTVRDITERKKAEEELKKLTVELKEERDLLNLIKENTNTNLAYLDTDFNLVRANSAFVHTFGHSEEEFVGKNILNLLPGKEYQAMFKKTKDTGETVEFKAQPLKFKDQPERGITYWDLTLIPVKDDLDHVQGLEFSLVDVTEIKRAEEEIRALNESLKQQAADLTASNKELEAFSYSVSHDLRAPLRNIDGFSQALLEDYSSKLDEKGKDFLKRVRSATQRMGGLIDDLLQLSLTMRKEMQRKEVDLSQLAHSIIKELKEAEPERQVEVAIKEKALVSGDARLLREMLVNLLGNAWKFTSQRSLAKIEFGLIEKNGEKLFFVKDNGAGFDMRYADKLFIPFQRLHSLSEFSGNGIGLAIVRRIIERHGGSVWAEGEVEKGATFYFKLL